MENTEKPKSSLDLARQVVAFARTLTDDEAMISSIFTIGYQAVEADRLACRRSESKSS